MSAESESKIDILRAALDNGDWPTALPILHEMARRDAGVARHWANLGAVLCATGADPSLALRRAVLLAPDVADYLNDFGAVGSEGRDEARRLLVLAPLHGPAAVMSALHAFGENNRPRGFMILRRLRLAEPGNLDATFLLGQFLDLAGREAEAIRLYRAALCIAPDDPMGARRDLARHGVAPVREAYSSTYVEKVFDGYAANFDAHLTGRLNYSGPETLRSLGLDTGILSDRRRHSRAVDIGCGTGLAGAVFRPFCDQLTGIDIAREMVRRAKEKAIYDRLLTGNAVTVLEQETGSYDLAVAADVSSYIGDLEPFFTIVSRRLIPGGALLMTAHELSGSGEGGIGLGLDGAHSHTPDYLRRTAGNAGLTLVEMRRGSMREEGGEPLATLFLAFTKPRQSGV